MRVRATEQVAHILPVGFVIPLGLRIAGQLTAAARLRVTNLGVPNRDVALWARLTATGMVG